jgi:catechol 2,3-dioxygenase-like lactoylglutathione lyase family enzyme
MLHGMVGWRSLRPEYVKRLYGCKGKPLTSLLFCHRGARRPGSAAGGIGMKVKRIVANIETVEFTAARGFYGELLGLDLLMDHGWIATYGSRAAMSVQISFASQGGSDTPVPDLSIEVDDLDAALERMRGAGIPIEYGPAVEPWGVRRFYVRDPFGKLINILVHL